MSTLLYAYAAAYRSTREPSEVAAAAVRSLPLGAVVRAVSAGASEWGRVSLLLRLALSSDDEAAEVGSRLMTPSPALPAASLSWRRLDPQDEAPPALPLGTMAAGETPISRTVVVGRYLGPDPEGLAVLRDDVEGLRRYVLPGSLRAV